MDEKIKKKIQKFAKANKSKINDCNVIMGYWYADIIGVLLGIKPACIVDTIYHEELRNVIDKLGDFVVELGLEYIQIKDVLKMKPDQEVEHHTFYISKKFEDAELLADVSNELIDIFKANAGEDEKVKTCHRRIGRILGYPETAIDYYILRYDKIITNDFTAEDKAEADSYYHFIHSKLNADEEFDEYDRPIHEAMDEILPDFSEAMREDRPTARWI